MNLYRYNADGKLYVLYHLILDIHHLNANAFSGIWAFPYKWSGPQVTHTLNQFRMGELERFEPEKFAADKFLRVAELSYL